MSSEPSATWRTPSRSKRVQQMLTPSSPSISTPPQRAATDSTLQTPPPERKPHVSLTGRGRVNPGHDMEEASPFAPDLGSTSEKPPRPPSATRATARQSSPGVTVVTGGPASMGLPGSLATPTQPPLLRNPWIDMDSASPNMVELTVTPHSSRGGGAPSYLPRPSRFSANGSLTGSSSRPQPIATGRISPSPLPSRGALYSEGGQSQLYSFGSGTSTQPPAFPADDLPIVAPMPVTARASPAKAGHWGAAPHVASPPVLTPRHQATLPASLPAATVATSAAKYGRPPEIEAERLHRPA